MSKCLAIPLLKGCLWKSYRHVETISLILVVLGLGGYLSTQNAFFYSPTQFSLRLCFGLSLWACCLLDSRNHWVTIVVSLLLSFMEKNSIVWYKFQFDWAFRLHGWRRPITHYQHQEGYKALQDSPNPKRPNCGFACKTRQGLLGACLKPKKTTSEQSLPQPDPVTHVRFLLLEAMRSERTQRTTLFCFSAYAGSKKKYRKPNNPKLWGVLQWGCDDACLVSGIEERMFCAGLFSKKKTVSEPLRPESGVGLCSTEPNKDEAGPTRLCRLM